MVEQPYFGQRLKALRLARGLSQAALAGDSMSTGYLSRLESGARPPTARVKAYLAQRLEVEASELGAAPALARVLDTVISGADDDGMADRLAEALAADKGSAPALRWQALWLLARMRGDQGAYDEEYALLTELAGITDDQARPELHARVSTQLSRCARILGDNARARECAAEAVRLSEGLGLTDRERALHALISAEAETGSLAEARVHAAELCELTEHAPGPAFTKALWAFATVCIRQGAHAEARKALERALAGLDGHDDLALWMRLRLAAASLYLQSSPPDVDLAGARLDEVQPVLALVGVELLRQEMLSLRAHLAFERGHFGDARELVDLVREQDALMSFRDQIRLDALHSRLLIVEGQTDAGVQQLEQLAQRAHDALNVELAAEIWRRLAETLAGLRGVAS